MCDGNDDLSHQTTRTDGIDCILPRTRTTFPITQLTIDVFDATAITLSSDWSALERAVIEPVAGAYNTYAQAVAYYAEVLSSGLRRRMRN